MRRRVWEVRFGANQKEDKMKKIMLALSLLLMTGSVSMAASSWSPSTPNYVSGYTTDSGTVVAPYYRASPGMGQ